MTLLEEIFGARWAEIDHVKNLRIAMLWIVIEELYSCL